MWSWGLWFNLPLFDKGCNNVSVYGRNCDIPCPANCKDNTCHIESGVCYMCKPGWSGIKCNTSKMANRIISCFFSLQIYRSLLSIILIIFKHCKKVLQVFCNEV